jgi:hypothetical protein
VGPEHRHTHHAGLAPAQVSTAWILLPGSA